MKRAGYLYEQIYNWENLLLAYKKARQSKKGWQVEDYSYYWEHALYDTQQDLKNQCHQFGAYHQFKIYEPKERVITSAPFQDRVVHHAICNVIGPVLDKPLIVDSYACRKGKGLHRAVKKAFYWYKNSQYHYRLDIRKFYYSIDHGILLWMLTRKIKDAKVLELMKRLLKTHDDGLDHYTPFPGDDLLDMIRPRGLPIGNLTSQVLANYYLYGLDHFIREKMHLVKYVRYMDDMVVFGDDQAGLRQARQLILEELARIRLHSNAKKDYICHNSQGLDFLGFRLVGTTIRVRSQNLCRFRRKMKAKSKDHNIELSKLLLSYNGHLGYLLGGHSKKICNDILNDIVFQNDQRKWKLVV